MKTEQEQIEEIQEIIGDSYEYDSISAELGSGDGYINTEEAAKALIKAGYGDVSEYKAEIERLKAEVKSLKQDVEEATAIGAKHVELTIKMLGRERAAVKQAQIDVLNKLKDIVFDYLGVKNIKEAEALSLLDSTLTYDVVTCGIDELIKEVENE